MTPRPFALKVPEAVLTDLRARLERVRWPDEAPNAGWQHGSSLAYMKELVAYWRDRYDWRTQEARLNQLKQFTASVGGIDIHFIHEPGVGPSPMPLVLSHGWPGSIVEFERIIPMLTDPGRFGGDPADAFTVVAPSLPGYAFSFSPGQPRFGIVEMTRQRVRPSFERANYEPCKVCGGRGVVKSARSTAVEVLRRVRAGMAQKKREVVEVIVHPAVHHYLMNQARRQVVELEDEFLKSIVIVSDPQAGPDHVQIRYR